MDKNPRTEKEMESLETKLEAPTTVFNITEYDFFKIRNGSVKKITEQTPK